MSFSMEVASPEQIKCIWGQARKIGLDKVELHEKCLAVTGEEHISHLTRYQAIRLIDSLMGKKPREFYPVEHVQRNDAERPISRASQKQVGLILALAGTLEWRKDGRIDMDRVNGFLRSQYSVDNINWMDPQMAGKCINAMKGMVAGGRKERKGYHGT